MNCEKLYLLLLKNESFLTDVSSLQAKEKGDHVALILGMMAALKNSAIIGNKPYIYILTRELYGSPSTFDPLLGREVKQISFQGISRNDLLLER